VLHDLGEVQEAAELNQEIIQIISPLVNEKELEKKPEHEKPQFLNVSLDEESAEAILARACNNLAANYLALRKNEEAKELFLRSLNIYLSIQPLSQRVAECYNNLLGAPFFFFFFFFK